MSNDDFVHPTLPRGAATRILTLLSGRYDELVRCTTRPFLLADAPPYDALSYTWGTETNAVLIELNGNPFTVRINLWCFLRRLRQLDTELVLWCDMLCIDQNNPIERGHQVRFMGDTYRDANYVWIWLGEEQAGNGRALSLLSDIDQIRKEVVQPTATEESLDRKIREGLVTQKISNQYGTSKRKHLRQLMIPAFLGLLNRDYWPRVWIIQEVTLARNATVYCGSCSLQL